MYPSFEAKLENISSLQVYTIRLKFQNFKF